MSVRVVRKPLSATNDRFLRNLHAELFQNGFRGRRRGGRVLARDQVAVHDNEGLPVLTVFEAGAPFPETVGEGERHDIGQADSGLFCVGEGRERLVAEVLLGVVLREAVEDGRYQVTLSPDVTSELPTGSARLEAVVVPIPVAVPAFTSMDFVVTP